MFIDQVQQNLAVREADTARLTKIRSRRHQQRDGPTAATDILNQGWCI